MEQCVENKAHIVAQQCHVWPVPAEQCASVPEYSCGVNLHFQQLLLVQNVAHGLSFLAHIRSLGNEFLMRDTTAVEKYLQHHFFSRLVPVTLHLTWWCWWYAPGKFTIGFGSYRKHHGSWAM